MPESSPAPPPRIAVFHPDEATLRGLRDVLSPLGDVREIEADIPEVLVYALTPETFPDLRARLDSHNPATIVLLHPDHRALVADLKSLPISCVLLIPASPDQVALAVEVALARHRERVWLQAENDRLQQTLNNRKLIERAKGAIMKRFRWTEPEAFRRLQRAAMNRRVPMAELARQILDGHEVPL